MDLNSKNLFTEYPELVDSKIESYINNGSIHFSLTFRRESWVSYFTGSWAKYVRQINNIISDIESRFETIDGKKFQQGIRFEKSDAAEADEYAEMNEGSDVSEYERSIWIRIMPLWMK